MKADDVPIVCLNVAVGAETKCWAGAGLNRRHQDFQTCPRRPPQTHDPLWFVTIRALPGVSPAWYLPIMTDHTA